MKSPMTPSHSLGMCFRRSSHVAKATPDSLSLASCRFSSNQKTNCIDHPSYMTSSVDNAAAETSELGTETLKKCDAFIKSFREGRVTKGGVLV